MFQLRDYQEEAVLSTMRYFDKHKANAGNPLIVLPTGTGKSLVIAGLMQYVYKNYGTVRTLMITHVKELIEQNFDKLMKLWPEAPAGIYSAGLNRKDRFSMITFSGIQSIAKAANFFLDVDLIIVDEAHLISPNESTNYQKFFAEIKKHNPCLKIIGLTATPFRLGFGSIVQQEDDEEGTALFNEVTFDGSTVECFNWFIQEGYLLPVVPKRTKYELDVTGVKLSGGEYVAKELQTAVNKDYITEKALTECMEIADKENRQSWLIFCSGIDHAIDTAFMLESMGVPCAALHGNLGGSERDAILRDFKSGKLRAVTNNNILTTGFDHTALDLLVILRPSQSPGLWVQMLGRGTRPHYEDGFDLSTRDGRLASINASHKQNCLVLDFSGNTRKLGPINDPVLPKRPGQKGKGPAPVKTCPYCEAYNHASARYCGGQPKPYQLSGFCGAEFEIQTKLKKDASTQELVKNNLPVTEFFRVDYITYMANFNRGDRTKPPTLKVSYHSDHRTIEEFVCLFHSNPYAQRKASHWWKDRTDLPMPENVEEALEVVSQLRAPTHIYVRTDTKFPEILNQCYDGTNFGRNDLPVNGDRVPIQVMSPNALLKGLSKPDNVVNAPLQQAQPTTALGKMILDLVNEGNVPVEQTIAAMDFDDDVPF